MRYRGEFLSYVEAARLEAAEIAAAKQFSLSEFQRSGCYCRSTSKSLSGFANSGHTAELAQVRVVPAADML